jgi:hypothetical protein
VQQVEKGLARRGQRNEERATDLHNVFKRLARGFHVSQRPRNHLNLQYQSNPAQKCKRYYRTSAAAPGTKLTLHCTNPSEANSYCLSEMSSFNLDCCSSAPQSYIHTTRVSKHYKRLHQAVRSVDLPGCSATWKATSELYSRAVSPSPQPS